MIWSLRLRSFAELPIYENLTFFILVGWLGMVHSPRGRRLEAVIAGVGFLLVPFACVLLREFGHSLIAKRYGIRTHDSILLPNGSLAGLEGMAHC